MKCHVQGRPRSLVDLGELVAAMTTAPVLTIAGLDMRIIVVLSPLRLLFALTRVLPVVWVLLGRVV